MSGGAGNRGRGRPRLSEAEFRRIVEEVRDRHNISDVVGRKTKLKRAGNEMVGLCVFHKERSPSLRVDDAKGLYYCFGCGKSGDAIRFIQETENLSFMDALRVLGASDLPIVDPAERARRAEEDRAERAQAIAEAKAFWDRSAGPVEGTPAEVYAKSRGITMKLPPSIRFGMLPAWRDRETGEWGRDLPAMIGAVTIGDELVAIQRIFLKWGGRAKADMKRPKLSLGRVKGGALRLDAPGPITVHDGEIIITEGPEDGLSLAQEIPNRRVWVALGTAFMPEIVFPPEVHSVVIAGQNDGPGQAATEAAAHSLLERGLAVRTMYPSPGYKDWNDELNGRRA